jgi:hypothetical protein
MASDLKEIVLPLNTQVLGLEIATMNGIASEDSFEKRSEVYEKNFDELKEFVKIHTPKSNIKSASLEQVLSMLKTHRAEYARTIIQSHPEHSFKLDDATKGLFIQRLYIKE